MRDPDVAGCGPAEHARRLRDESAFGERAFERAAAIFRAVSDVPRLKILERLADGEWCVKELAEAAQVAQSRVSQQLRILRSERLVTRRRSNKHIYYALSDKHVADLIRNALDHATEEQVRRIPTDPGSR